MIINPHNIINNRKISEKNLFLVQDADRPMYVVADGFQDALNRWSQLIAAENNCAVDEIDMPDGIQYVASGDDFIV